MKLMRILTQIIIAGLLGSTAVRAALVPVTGDIAAGTTVTWYATNEYRLDTIVYVQTNATLIIEPGTVVKGATNVTIGRPGIPNLVSALWVTRGGKLYATGTVDKPIVFTAEGDNLNGNIPPTETALWGGVVIMGKARINTAKDVTGNAANPKYDVYEGVTSGGANGEHRFGGNDDEDSSGALRYVSIRHAGNEFAPDAELNALTMGGVGRGTVLEYVEVFAGSDDGFEWWGGTVNSKYLVSAFIEDDDFDTDQGYTGTNQFWFAIKPPWAGTGDSRGIESDGDLNQAALGELPISRWWAYNATLIGRGKTETSGSLGVGWNTRDEAAPNVFNSIFKDFNQGLVLDNDGLLHFTNATVLAAVKNNIWDVNVNANSFGQFLFTTGSFSNSVTGAGLGAVSYTNNQVLDPRPQTGSAAFTNVLAGAPVAVNYRGAFSGETDAWADGWTALSQYGYLKPAVSAPTNTAPVITDPALNTTYTINVGVNLAVTNTASDSDVPAQTLTFSKLSGLGTLTAGGVFTWRPQVADANTTNSVTVKVDDDGAPSLSATNTFVVVVNPLSQPTMSVASHTAGQFGLMVDGQAGPDYAVQATTNLVSGTWVTVFTTNAPAMPFVYTNAASEPAQFYRILVGPPLP